MSLFFVVLVPFFAAPFAAWAARFNRLAAAWTAAVATAVALGLLLLHLWPVLQGATVEQIIPWVPAIGLTLIMRLDGLGLMFALLILGIGLLVVMYARYYLSDRDGMGRFYAELLLFMGAMLGVVLSGQLIQLLMFWELTSLSSFLLIGYWSDRSEARSGARMALIITGLGGLALFAGLLLLGHIVGSYALNDVLAAGDTVRASPLYLPTLLLILLGALTKSAQFPFHFWLPRAMAAPTPVSAYLHSATMVNAGLFLLARLYPVLSGTPQWFWIVSGAGLLTLLLGAFIALFKHDLKALLAYSTISHLGLIALLLGIATPLALVAALFHVINHAIFKASLFMSAGIIDHETGTRDMRQLNGLWAFMPVTATLAMVSSASMAGVPLFNGFLSKEMFFAEAADLGTQYGWFFPVLVTLAGAFAVAYSIRFIHDVFFNGQPVNLPRAPHEPPRWMLVPVAILVFLCLFIGVLPNWSVAPFLHAAAAAALQSPPPAYSLALWHGVNPALLMSLTAMLLGVLIYLGRKPLFAHLGPRIERADARIVFDALVAGLFRLGDWLTRLLDKGSLQRQLALLLLAALVLGIAPWLGSAAPLLGTMQGPTLDPVSLVVGLTLIAAVGSVLALQRQRYLALLPMGVIGLIVALIFVKFSAPDLALTQLMVEVVTILLLLLALFFLPQTSRAEPSRLRLWRDALLALVAGLGVSLLTWAVLSRPYVPEIAQQYMQRSLPQGGGANVVNVILVDFRGYDTLGEITVLALAALGVFAMLKNLQIAPNLQARAVLDVDVHPPILATLMRLMLPLTLLVAAFILLRGHNAPGGGFIAGLITAIALLGQYLANGLSWTDARLRLDASGLMAAGLALALLTGLGSWAFGFPFLTSTFGHMHWPVVGDFELASAMAFDLGVYLVVVGATVLMLRQIGGLHGAATHQGARA
ncbi:MAG: monovalent cation/H+ antiporter subunit A [Burkholderiaceae bacterium]|nr:monovalent cation/H+ antiporter subunit A [Burkholderiaceae bacterium]